MVCSFLTTAYHGHLLPSSSWTSLLSPCKAILESSWEHLMCNLMINWCLRTWCILLSNVGMDQVSGLLNQPNVFGIFLGTKDACSIHQAIRLPDLVPNESYSFISPGETSLVHTIQAITSISWTSWTKTLLIYIYNIMIITVTFVSRTFIIHIELPCVQHLYCSERMYPKKTSIPCFLQPISSSWRPIQSAKGKADGSKLQQGSACSWCRSPMFCLLDSPCRFIF